MTMGYYRSQGKTARYVSDHVRRDARLKYTDRTKCDVCGYSVYVEVCHRKPISDFGDDVLIDVINDEDNIMILCPNHHKEHDMGLL